MAGMVASASTGVMSPLLAKLATLLGDEYKMLKSVRKEVSSLKDELSSMDALLQKLAYVDDLDVQQKEWRDKVRELAYDFEDCIDVFMHDLGGQRDKDGLIRKSLRSFKKIRVRHQLGNQIQQLKARVEAEAKRRDRYKFSESVSSSRPVVEIDNRLHALYAEVDKLVGIDGPRKKITQLLEEDASAQQLKVVSIVGFGGVGKTTLAKQVYDQIKGKFDCTAFVSVSRNPDMLKILTDILSQGNCHGERTLDDQQKLIDDLRQHLGDKRYLIVIDDIWSIEAWDIIKYAFVPNKLGSRVITTTRSQEVSKHCCLYCHGCQQPYEMQPLSEFDSRRLFFSRIFGSDDCCPDHLKNTAESILGKCKGVPLAIISIASLLASHQRNDIDQWERIKESLGNELDTNPRLGCMKHVLTLSYNDLSPNLKTCFLYLGVYPEDHKISKVDLVRRWIAEGFVSEKHGLDLEEVAENYFNDLVNRSMIHPFEIEAAGDISAWRVHDLMLDLIISKCEEENFITVTDEKKSKEGKFKVRRLSHQSEKGDLALESMSVVSQVRSFTTFCVPDCLQSLLPKLKLLRVLELDVHVGHGMCIDLSAISNLFMLRHLSARNRAGMPCYKLPSKIGMLQDLLTLEILHSLNIPSDISCLSSLRHLEAPFHVELPIGIGKLRALRTLWSFDIAYNCLDNIRDLGEMTHLRELQVVEYRHRHGGVQDVGRAKFDALAASLGKLEDSCNLRSLALAVDISPVPSDFVGGLFTRPSHLRQLYVLGMRGMQSVPKWMGQAKRLTDLLFSVEELQTDDVQVLAGLPCLLYLDLGAFRIPEGNVVIHPKTFPALRVFRFWYYSSCVTFEPGAMPSLRRLSLKLTGGGGGGGGAGEVQDGSPLVGVHHLLSLERIDMDFYHGSPQFWSLFWAAVRKHPRRLDIRTIPPTASANQGEEETADKASDA